MRNRRAFTLIELLIVVAIITIMSAATMALYTAPMRQQVQVDSLAEAERGAGLAMATLVEDLHAAATVVEIPTTTHDQAYLLVSADRSTGVLYFRDSKHWLRRATLPGEQVQAAILNAANAIKPTTAAPLVPSVTAFSLTPVEDGRAVELLLRSERDVLGRPIRAQRGLVISLGHHQAGGAP